MRPVAVPSIVAKLTLMSRLLEPSALPPPETVIRKGAGVVPASPSLTEVGLIVRVGLSSSTIVPMPIGLAGRRALTALSS